MKKRLIGAIIVVHCYFLTILSISQDFITQLRSNYIVPLFTYHDNLKQCLIDLIQGEKKAIHIVAYNLTNYDVVQQLLKARERKVKIEVITGLDGVRCNGEQITRLSQAGIPTYIISSGNVLMHNKYILFSNNDLLLKPKSIVWTGSANITERGLTKNYENVTVLMGRAIFDSYLCNFDFLKKIAQQQTSSVVRLAGANSKAQLILPLVQGMISSSKVL